MVNYSPPTLDVVFSALADPKRRAMLERLAYGEATISELAAPFAEEITLPGVLKHLRVLETAGLIVRRKEGRVNFVRLAAAPMQDAAQWLSLYRHFWQTQFDSLEKYLSETTEETADDQRNA